MKPLRHPVLGLFRPIVRFLHTEAAGGIVLLACTAIALCLANSPWSGDYADFWHTHFVIGFGDWKLDQPLEWWVNDGLMTLFFFVVGLEIKREIVEGELRDPRKAALPAAAALGGMIVPALIYYSLQRGTVGERGWGVPMATDIAFVVGVLALLGPRVPAGLKILLLSLAIVDDLGAVLVIAVAYTSNTSFIWLGVAGLLLVFVFGARLAGVRAFGFYFFVGGFVWLAMVHSGVHPTIAGVILGLITPARGWVGKSSLLALLDNVLQRLKVDPTDDRLHSFNDEMLAVAEYSQNALSPLDRLEKTLHPWVAFGIMPLFALVNAGVPFRGELLASPVALAVALGLFIGKPVGVVLFSWLAARLGVARFPVGVTFPVLIGAGLLAGIGFTMSLFISGLAFPGQDGLLDAAKSGTLTGSVVSAITGAIVLLAVLPPLTRRHENAHGV
ncbi:MAG: Na+/H+ antiporter NhaA [Planctomycetia bacterium]|nr:Na+/H+ antiporter NhaA [Planctomycetia bacterium]